MKIDIDNWISNEEIEIIIKTSGSLDREMKEWENTTGKFTFSKQKIGCIRLFW